MIGRSDLINLVSQFGIKLIAIPYSLYMIGLTVRLLPENADFLMLSAQNYISITGLAQLGLGGFLLRRISHVWAERRSLSDMPDVRGAFWISALLALICAVALVVLAALGNISVEILPLLLLSLVGLSALIGDYVRLATGKIAELNLIMLGCFAAGFLTMILHNWLFSPNLHASLVIAFGPAYIASLISFGLLLRRPDFRAMIAPRSPKIVFGPLKSSVPLFLTSAGFTAILNVPLAHKVFSSFPDLTREELSCLRLFASGLNVFFFALQPLIPAILRSRYSADAQVFRRSSIGLLSLIIVFCLIAGIGFSIVSAPFILLWLGGIVVPPDVARGWGVITFLWLTLTTLAFFCQATSRPFLAAASLLVAALAALVAGMVTTHWTLEGAMIMGLGTGVLFALGAAALAITDPIAPRAVTGSAGGVR